MKRFGFFLGVFSVGLVIFLVFTGQLSKLFDRGNPGGSDAGRAETEDGPTVVRLTFDNFEKQRELFTFQGEITNQTSLSINLEFRDSPWSLANASLDVPIYPSARPEEPEGGAPAELQHFRLAAQRVHYNPDPQFIDMEGVKGEGDDGTRFETARLKLTWNEMGIEITGDAPVTLGYPALELHGARGLQGQIESTFGLREISIHAPVVVGLDRGGGGHLFGFQLDDTAGGSERIFLVGEGPLRIERHETLPDKATFEDRVTVFESPATELFPPPEIPDTRFECGSLVLSLGASTQRVETAVAYRGATPVTAVIQGVYRVEGTRLEWAEGRAEAVLDGVDPAGGEDRGIEIHGPVGVFSATRARLRPHERRCMLDENVKALLHVAAIQEASKKAGSEEPSGESTETPPSSATEESRIEDHLAGDLELVADRAEIEYHDSSTSPEGGSRLKLFRATSDSAHGVRVREVTEGGAQLVGSRIEYDPAEEIVRVLGAEGETEPHPRFREGENWAQARVIELHRLERELVFDGQVVCRLHQVPARAQDRAPQWMIDRSGLPHDLTAGRLRIRWGETGILVTELEAWAEDETPLVMSTTDAAPRAASYALEGRHLSWQREGSQAGEAVLSGDGGQQRLTAGETEVQARTIRFDVVRRLARADGDVQVSSRRGALVERLSTPEDDRSIRLGGDHLELRLSLEGPSESTPSAPSGAPVTAVEFARLWSDGEDGRVTADDGEFAVEASELAWHATEGKVLLAGSGRQILRRGPEHDTVSANKITIWSETRRILLNGAVDARFRQGSLQPRRGRAPAVTEGSSDDVEWHLQAGRVEIQVVERPRPGAPDSTDLVLKELAGQNGVTINNMSEGITFHGSACQWDGERQVLRLFAPDGQGAPQTLTRKNGANVDEVFGREIRVARIRVGETGKTRLNVYFDERVNATFHARPQGPVPSASGPTPEYDLNCSSFLMILDSVNEGADRPIREARAWGGDVIFQADRRYKILADHALYQRSSDSLTFYGTPGVPVQLNDGKGNRPASLLRLRSISTGRYRIEIDGGEPWQAGELEDTLELLKGDE